MNDTVSFEVGIHEDLTNQVTFGSKLEISSEIYFKRLFFNVVFCGMKTYFTIAIMRDYGRFIT